MTRYYIELSCTTRGEAAEVEAALEAHVLGVLDALLDDSRAVDPDVSIKLSDGELLFTLAVDAETSGAAVDLANEITLDAIRRVGGHPQGWPEIPSDEGLQVGVEEFEAHVRPAAPVRC